MMSRNAISAICALMNENISRDTSAVDAAILDLESKINEERSFSQTIYCGMGGEWDALIQDRAWILEGYYVVDGDEIVLDAPWLH